LQGASVFAAVLAVYVVTAVSGHSEADVRGLTFATLVVGNLGLILVNRSWTRSALSGFAADPNAALGWVLGGASLFLALVMGVPALQTLFGFASFQVIDVVGVVAAGLSGVVWFEAYKFVRSRRKPPVSGE
jgi:Ca2+-transporting ATPase